jgi:PAS domain S-box-containing protein
MLAAPLVANEDVLGVVVMMTDRASAFSDAHLRLVEAAAHQVATAINNAELYRLIRDQAERLGSMLRSQQVEASKSQAILESVADGVMVSDSAGEIILFNAAAERILDLKRDEVLGRPSAELTGLYGGGAERWAEVMDQWMNDPGAYKESNFLEERITVSDKFISVHLSPVAHGDEFLGLVSVFRDITREVEVDRIKSEFVATVSHELRTPMTSIKGYADLLLMGAAGTLSEDQERFLDIIKNNADRLSLLVNDLLDISRIEQGRMELEITDLNVTEVINDLMDSLEGRFASEDKLVRMTVEIPPDIPTVQADYDRVTQILLNIVLNAYQYTPEGGSVTISAHREENGVRIDIADTGIGISPEDQARIFDRFFRGEDPVVMATAGTGLGLSIVQHLIEMHHGRLLLESEVGRGTTFSVLFPYRFQDEEQGQGVSV